MCLLSTIVACGSPSDEVGFLLTAQFETICFVGHETLVYMVCMSFHRKRPRAPGSVIVTSRMKLTTHPEGSAEGHESTSRPVILDLRELVVFTFSSRQY